jgi:hypothetical protein
METSENINESISPSAPQYGAGTDPSPYIIGAYALGLLFILGFAILVMLERRHLRMLMSALKKSP